MFIQKVQADLRQLLTDEPNTRQSVLLNLDGEYTPGEVAVKIRSALGAAAKAIYLSNFVCATLNKSDVDTLLADFPEVVRISLNRKATTA